MEAEGGCIRASGRPVTSLFTVALSGEPPRCTSELLQPQQRRSGPAGREASAGTQTTEPGAAAAREKRKSASVCGVYLLSCARLDFCFDFHFSLIFSSPLPSGSCATFSACLGASDMGGAPQTAHYRTGIPPTLQEPLSNTFVVGDPFICAPQKPFEGHSGGHTPSSSANQSTLVLFDWIFMHRVAALNVWLP